MSDNKLDLRISELMQMQQALYEKNPHWGKFEPDKGFYQLLWMVGELGEVIDVVKKAPRERYMQPTDVREHFVEEFTDVLMYFVDTLLCYGITAEELSAAYRKKFEYNMIRDYVGANAKKYGFDPADENKE